MSKERYESPLASRYASAFMLHLFSPDMRFETWRRLWVALARAERNLGLPVTAEQVAELEAHITDIDYEKAAQWEKKLRHDVMAHVHTYGELCPKAMPIIHLGATSCYVTDNADLIIYREGLRYLRGELLAVVANLSKFAEQYKATPTLGYTHYQPAQLVTVGKRATLWMNELLMDLEEVEHRIASLKLLGSKGTTGTQASFVELFEGDDAKIKAVEADIAAALVETGVRRILVAGGETSGAVVSRLGVRALRIGETIAPGVPWTETLLDPANPDAPHLALALKSGNFGGEDFFMQALGLLANAN